MFKIFRRIKEAMAPELNRADLITLLASLDPKNSYEERINSLAGIMEWIRLPTKQQDDEPYNFIRSRNVRLRFLFQLLERNPAEAKLLATTLQEFIAPGDAIGLYCLTGISENTGFLNELTNRLVQRILPDAHTDKDLAEQFKTLFTEEEDADWIEAASEETIPPFLEFARKHNINFTPLKEDFRPSMVILAAQAAALGTSREIRSRIVEQRLADSSFLHLNYAVNSGASGDELLTEISSCRLVLEEVKRNIESTGVSVDLIFKLEKIDAILNRMEMLILLEKERSPKGQHAIIAFFISRLIRVELQSLGVKQYLRENLHMLTRKIVERAGEKGEHYIINTPEDRNKILVAACWAGVLTTFTAVVKFFVGQQRFPLFFEGFFFFVNYGVGFLLIQKYHLALSSKQPAYMASALSQKFELFKQTRQLSEIILMVRKVSKSQYYATLGNLLLVIPVTIAVDWLFYASMGEHIVSPQAARDIVLKHHPLKSMTLFYAALTGIFLWFSSVIAGWVENWIVFRNLPEAMKGSSFFNQLFGEKRNHEVASAFPKTVGGIAGNLSIALFLAAPIIIGKITGIPLDIRHVTLAAGTMILALNSMEWGLQHWPAILTVFSSIVMIGVLNFSVSFYFAIRMAALARNVEARHLKIIFKYALRRPRSKSFESD